MESTIPPEAEEPAPLRDLRDELFENLSAQFDSQLNSNTSLSTAARKALVELLNSEAPTAVEIIAAASKKDPSEQEEEDDE